MRVGMVPIPSLFFRRRTSHVAGRCPESHRAGRARSGGRGGVRRNGGTVAAVRLGGHAWGGRGCGRGVINREGFADDAVPPPSEAERGQLLRALASDAIRGALERHFGVRFAFQNCHRVAAFRPGDVDGDSCREFVSVRSQVLNQSPALRDC